MEKTKAEVAKEIQEALPDVPPLAAECVTHLHGYLVCDSGLSYTLSIDDAIRYLAYMRDMRINILMGGEPHGPNAIIQKATDNILLPLYPESEHAIVQAHVDRLLKQGK